MQMPVTEISFDYSSLAIDARRIVKQKTTEIRERLSVAAENIIAIGVHLIAVKDQLDHGQFGSWLAAEFEWTDRSAQKMMRVATQFKSEQCSDLKIAPSALYLLASDSTPKELRDEIVSEAKAGKTVTHAEVKKRVAKKKPAPAPIPKKKPPVTVAPPDDQTVVMDEPDSPEDVAEPTEETPVAPSDPWSGFESKVREEMTLLRAAGRRLTQIFGLTEGRRFTSPFAQDYTYAGTMAVINSIVATLEDGLPAAVNPKGGYLSIRQLKRQQSGTAAVRELVGGKK